MSVIKEAYMTGEITRHDLLPLSFLKKSAYTGSKEMLRYKLEKTEEGGLRCHTWTTPYCMEETEEADICEKDFPFSEEGISDMIAYLNTCLREAKAAGRKADEL